MLLLCVRYYPCAPLINGIKKKRLLLQLLINTTPLSSFSSCNTTIAHWDCVKQPSHWVNQSSCSLPFFATGDTLCFLVDFTVEIIKLLLMLNKHSFFLSFWCLAGLAAHHDCDEIVPRQEMKSPVCRLTVPYIADIALLMQQWPLLPFCQLLNGQLRFDTCLNEERENLPIFILLILLVHSRLPSLTSWVPLNSGTKIELH